MTMSNAKHRRKKENFLCNFRAPNNEAYREWKEWVDLCKNELHTDVCYMTLSNVRAARRAIEETLNQTQIPNVCCHHKHKPTKYLPLHRFQSQTQDVNRRDTDV
jgi:hypothetical protein